MRQHTRNAVGFVVLAILMAALFYWNINTGSVHLSLERMLTLLRWGNDGTTEGNILWKIRLSRLLGAALLGENYAKSMGVNVKGFRVALILLSSILSACVTAFAGPISFVGIAVPHITRLIFRTSRPMVLIPATFLTGSVFCLACDLIARTAFSPTELTISTVTSVLGAPVVIWLMIKRRRNG